MSKVILIVYIVSLLGSGRDVLQVGQQSTFNSMRECQQSLQAMKIENVGKDISGRVVAYCAGSDVKVINNG